MNQWGSSFARWDDTVSEWLEAQGDPGQMQAVTNTAFALGWEGEGEKIEHHKLSARAEDWGDLLPASVVAITIGADVQGDRI
jgi:phage terminase large subunit GpA-like protein